MTRTEWKIVIKGVILFGLGFSCGIAYTIAMYNGSED